MTRSVAVFLLAMLAGCASQPSSTKNFFAQENAIGISCVKQIPAMPFEARFAVDFKTRRSPASTVAMCYATQLQHAAAMARYPHQDIVNAYTNYLVQVTAALDRGEIDQQTGVTYYRQAVSLFNQSIKNADNQLAQQSRRNFLDGLAAIAIVNAQVDRDRAAAAKANRPVLCTSTGVYQTNSIICQ